MFPMYIESLVYNSYLSDLSVTFIIANIYYQIIVPVSWLVILPFQSLYFQTVNSRLFQRGRTLSDPFYVDFATFWLECLVIFITQTQTLVVCKTLTSRVRPDFLSSHPLLPLFPAELSPLPECAVLYRCNPSLCSSRQSGKDLLILYTVDSAVSTVSPASVVFYVCVYIHFCSRPS